MKFSSAICDLKSIVNDVINKNKCIQQTTMQYMPKKGFVLRKTWKKKTCNSYCHLGSGKKSFAG